MSSAAYGLLQQGRTREALRLARESAARAPRSPDALHVLALCHAAAGDSAGALRVFANALALAPRDAPLLANYANLLEQLGRRPEAVAQYRRALEAAAQRADIQEQLGLHLLEMGEAPAARQALEAATRLQPQAARAWHGLGSACRELGDLAAAELAFRHAVAITPDAGALWVNLGVLRRLQGDPAEALACYAAARKAGFAGAEIADAEAGAYLDLGQPARAATICRRLVAESPAYIPGQLLLAQLLWEHGASLAPREDPFATLLAAARSQPGNRELIKAAAALLLDAGRAVAALQLLQGLRAAADEPDVLMQLAQALDDVGDPQAAGRVYADALPALRGHVGFLNRYTRHLLRQGDAAAAAARAEEALALKPTDQQALAWLGVAWRLLQDPREHWLCGYDHLIAELPVDAPQGFANQAAFLGELAALLDTLHTAQRAPLKQTLRGGTQTAGMLFGRSEPLLLAARDVLHATVRRYVAQLPRDPAHPFLGRRTDHIRFSGCWSVRLNSAGHHVNHCHPEGWISSAYYVSLPPAVASGQDPDHGGWIQFGTPPADLVQHLPPRRMIRPREGHLVLFPSYIWHGTTPFVAAQPRLTMAFDAVPA